MSWSVDWYSVRFAAAPSWICMAAIFMHACIFMDILTARLTGKHTALWNCLRQRGLRITGETYILVLAMLLPAHVLCLYGELGEPKWTSPVLGDYNVDLLVNDSFWPSYGNLSVDTTNWIVTAHNNTNISSFVLTDRECYEPDSGEFKILVKLLDDRPKQSYCESTMGSLAVEALGWDDDGWEETFEFCLRIFAALAGIIANKVLEIDNGGFMEDLTDIFDMYLFTFADTEQAHEGRQLLREGSIGKMHEWVWTCVVLAYASMLARVYLALACGSSVDPAAWISKNCGSCCKYEKERVRSVLNNLLSVLFIELPFLALRIYAAGIFRIPVSLMGVKNAFEAVRDIRGIVQCGRQEPEAELDGIQIGDIADNVKAQAKLDDSLEATGQAGKMRMPYGGACRNVGRADETRPVDNSESLQVETVGDSRWNVQPADKPQKEGLTSVVPKIGLAPVKSALGSSSDDPEGGLRDGRQALSDGLRDGPGYVSDTRRYDDVVREDVEVWDQPRESPRPDGFCGCMQCC
eukprot:CAMPEP_0180440032 /NCGR_PEP_ID=MMETSP1036_2-20121128/12896_1 /TAXON_ID=632150 /ORGANISM="Azadinium spinosum, Strain 3D9" /LENGTH=520 /DNA_ID=CAMNT_0022446193 /DNA_START=112 /DNA_END=1674 /DNA_ORIENTATION=+